MFIRLFDKLYNVLKMLKRAQSNVKDESEGDVNLFNRKLISKFQSKLLDQFVRKHVTKTGLLLSQINHGIYLKDRSNELSVLVDRAVGGSSIVDGQLELMLHRFNPFFLLFLSCFYTGISKNMKQLKGKMPVLCCFGPLRFPSGSVKFELYGSYT